MKKDELVECMKKFLSKREHRNMLKFTSATDSISDEKGKAKNGRKGWEKWLQYEFAYYLFNSGYGIAMEHRFNKMKTNNYNFIDITYKPQNKKGNSLLNAIEFKVDKSIANIISGIKNDLEGLSRIDCGVFKSIACVGFFLNEQFEKEKLKNSTFKLMKYFESDECKYAHVSEEIFGWRYLIVHWSDSVKDDKTDRHNSFLQFQKMVSEDMKKHV